MCDADPLIILRQNRGTGGSESAPLRVPRKASELVIGRVEAADWCLTDPRVSRRHAVVRVNGDTVLLRDAGSRHGTAINDREIEADEEVPIIPGDRIRFGAVQCTAHRGGSVIATRSVADESTKITVVPRHSVGGLQRARLRSLMDAAKLLAKADSREDVAQAVVESAGTLPECTRVGVLVPIADDSYELLSSFSADSGELRPSRSLLGEAAKGQLVQISADSPPMDDAHSIVSMGVRSALCVPITAGKGVDSLLYLDTRGDERAIDSDTLAFCDALCAVAGLAFERIAAEESEARRQRIELDLRSARDAQKLLFPKPNGSAPGLEYVFESIPGRFVGGDLFDLFELDTNRTAFFLGDAVGKGAGAGVLMVAVQTLLRSLLESGCGLAEAVSQTNASLALRSASNKFVTLIAGIWNASTRVLDIVDAGHGLLLLKRDDDFEPFTLAGGIPIGIQRQTTCDIEQIHLPRGGRLVAFSDGVSEQTNQTGEQFGVPNIIECLRGSESSAEDVQRITDAVRQHAEADFADDLTVASIDVRL
ncbi:MAG: SpoIIE family protein phosphatase [Planctomycetota bacterium]